MGVVAKKSRPIEKALELQKFFGVTSLETVLGLRRYQAAFRSGVNGKRKRSREAVAAWLRIGELEAQKRECAPFNKRKLKQALHTIRKMTLQLPDRFEHNLHQVLANSGVALVLCPHLPRTYSHGATFWLNKDKAVLMITLRYKWADIFWFSLFHKLGHILLHNRQSVILEGRDIDPLFENQEAEADQFAADILIPPSTYKEFVKKECFYPADIEQFAAQLGISPGIVVGRLQNDKYLAQTWHNRLRARFEWKPTD